MRENSRIKAVVIFGGPGSGAIVAQSVAALADGQSGIKLVGFLNDILPCGTLVSGAPVLGPFASWRDLPEEIAFLAPLHKAKVMLERVRTVEGLGIPLHRWATIIDPRSAVASDATIGHGCFIGPFASVGPGARLGVHTVVRAGAHVSHDCAIGNFVSVGTNAVVCGYCVVHDGAYIAPGATIRDGRQVGKFAVVGLGAVVMNDLSEFVVVAGSSARHIGETLTEDDAT